MIIKFVMKVLPTCLPSGLTVAAPDAFGRKYPVCARASHVTNMILYTKVSSVTNTIYYKFKVQRNYKTFKMIVTVWSPEKNDHQEFSLY